MWSAPVARHRSRRVNFAARPPPGEPAAPRLTGAAGHRRPPPSADRQARLGRLTVAARRRTHLQSPTPQTRAGRRGAFGWPAPPDMAVSRGLWPPRQACTGNKPTAASAAVAAAPTWWAGDGSSRKEKGSRRHSDETDGQGKRVADHLLPPTATALPHHCRLSAAPSSCHRWGRHRRSSWWRWRSRGGGGSGAARAQGRRERPPVAAREPRHSVHSRRPTGSRAWVGAHVQLPVGRRARGSGCLCTRCGIRGCAPPRPKEHCAIRGQTRLLHAARVGLEGGCHSIAARAHQWCMGRRRPGAVLHARKRGGVGRRSDDNACPVWSRVRRRNAHPPAVLWAHASNIVAWHAGRQPSHSAPSAPATHCVCTTGRVPIATHVCLGPPPSPARGVLVGSAPVPKSRRGFPRLLARVSRACLRAFVAVHSVASLEASASRAIRHGATEGMGSSTIELFEKDTRQTALLPLRQVWDGSRVWV